MTAREKKISGRWVVPTLSWPAVGVTDDSVNAASAATLAVRVSVEVRPAAFSVLIVMVCVPIARLATGRA